MCVFMCVCVYVYACVCVSDSCGLLYSNRSEIRSSLSLTSISAAIRSLTVKQPKKKNTEKRKKKPDFRDMTALALWWLHACLV